MADEEPEEVGAEETTAPEPVEVEEVEMSVLDALREVSRRTSTAGQSNVCFFG